MVQYSEISSDDTIDINGLGFKSRHPDMWVLFNFNEVFDDEDFAKEVKIYETQVF